METNAGEDSAGGDYHTGGVYRWDGVATSRRGGRGDGGHRASVRGAGAFATEIVL